MRARWRLISVAAAVAALTGCGLGGRSTVPAMNGGGGGLTVSTANGLIIGESSSGTRLFLGIPYAAPPVGPLRFMPPAAHAKWSTPLIANKPGNVCPQFGPPSYPFGLDQETSEDCLDLNVTAPPSGGNLPVMVWIHGGSYIQGSGAFYPATRLALTGNMIVVTINYRLGLLGFLAASSLDTASGGTGKTGAYGTEDQIAALQWVHNNIAAFGGNPSNVTIAGESAGAISVCSLIANAASGGASAGLFGRAIVESGPCEAPFGTLASTEVTDASLTAAIGCSGSGTTQVTCLQRATLASILNAQKAVTAVFPSVGGADIPVQPKTTIGAFPTLMGGNKYEWGLFVALGLPPAPTSAAVYNATLNAEYGSTAGPIIAASPQYAYTSFTATPIYPQGFLALTTTLTDFAPADPLSVCFDVVNWQKQAASGKAMYAYEFSDPSAPTTLPYAPFSSLVPPGPLHAAEVQYVFPGIASPPSLTAPASGPPLTGAEAALSAQMIAYWANFVNSGNPNGTGLPNWPAFTTTSSALQLTTAGSGVGTGVDVDAEHNCSTFWEPLFASTGLLS
jgi:para-nitrobenzyl esterase